jgi:hypothetical protein
MPFALLAHEVQLVWRSLVDRRFVFVLLVCGGVLLIANQIPLVYRVALGQADGVGADLPLINQFYGPDQSIAGRFRWSGARSQIHMPGFGERGLAIRLRIMPITPEIQQQIAQVGIWVADREFAQLPLRLEGAQYHILLPATYDDHRFELRSPTFRGPNDERDLGVPIGLLLVQRHGFAWPAWQPTATWLVVVGVAWVTLRRTGITSHHVGGLVAFAVFLLGIAATCDPARTALAAMPFLLGICWGWVLIVGLAYVLPRVYRQSDIACPPPWLAWLLLVVFVVFVLRYTGKLYPSSMPGDINFHLNRFDELITGTIFLVARHRGVDFPYPPALYLLLAPLTLIWDSQRTLLHGAAALCDALSPCIVYAIAMRIMAPSAKPQTALIAAGLYALAPAGMLASWWNFSTYIFAQALMLVLVFVMLTSARSLPTLLLVLVLQLLVYLGHFSYYLNASLLFAGMTCLVVVAMCWRKLAFWHGMQLVGMLVTAQVLVLVLFFSFYIAVFQEQLSVVGAATDVALITNPGAIPAFIRSILGEGLRDHMGLFPVILAGCGMCWYIGTERRLPPQAFVLIAGTLLITVGFGLLPLISAANLTTRWLMFALWAVSILAAPVAIRFWHTGRAGRAITLGIAAYLLVVSASIWLGAFAWRIRPPEPF